MRSRLRTRALGPLAVGWVALALAAAAGLFWHQDLRYSLATPIPDGLVVPSSGSRLARPTVAAGTGEHPLLVHFFNPSCPCSRFAAEQLATLEKRFRGRLDVLLVPLGDGAGSAGRALAHLPRTTAGALELAHRYGAYSTPTAVLLGADGTLLFRGQYSSSRYCVDPARQYVRLALERVLGEAQSDAVELAMPPPFGCPLPVSTAEASAP